MLYGGLHSLHARPRPAPGPLAAAWGWASANGWRATAWRWIDWLDNEGKRLDHGQVELWVVTIVSLLALIFFGVALSLVARRPRG